MVHQSSLQQILWRRIYSEFNTKTNPRDHVAKTTLTGDQLTGSIHYPSGIMGTAHQAYHLIYGADYARLYNRIARNVPDATGSNRRRKAHEIAGV